MDKKLAIIVLHYRTAELTADCLDSLDGQLDREDRVVVVDNDSGDGSAERIEKHIEARGYAGWARVVRSPKNGGFAYGNNVGIHAELAHGYVLLNSDTLVCPDAIRELKRAMVARPDAALIGPKLETADGQHAPNAFGYVHPISELVRAARTGPITRLLRRYDISLPLGDEELEPEWLGFACVLIRREAIDQVGDLDEGFFMYFEDIDYCRRVREAGWTIRYWPSARVVHLLGGSSGVTSDAKQRDRAPRYYYEARARYFKKHYGTLGPLRANVSWIAGHGIDRMRNRLSNRAMEHREREATDIWIDALPRSASAAARARSTGGTSSSGHGESNGNPEDIGFLALLKEDLETHDGSLASPGFWAVAVHRFGNWRMDIRPRPLRAPVSILYRTTYTAVNWLWGIDLLYTVKLGRRVRLWHHGGMVLGAASIGNDVHIRHGTTFGVATRDQDDKKPVIEDGVDVGVGACVLGDVTIGHDSIIGANSVVVRSFPPHSTVFGVPARPVRMMAQAAKPAPESDGSAATSSRGSDDEDVQ